MVPGEGIAAPLKILNRCLIETLSSVFPKVQDEAASIFSIIPVGGIPSVLGVDNRVA